MGLGLGLGLGVGARVRVRVRASGGAACRVCYRRRYGHEWGVPCVELLNLLRR